MDKCIITAALTGGVHGKETNPNIPYTPEEFAHEARRCWNAGCSVVHIHCRDDQGKPTGEIQRVRETLEAIRAAAPEIIVNLSTAIGPGVATEQRIAPIVALEPEMASLNTNSMNFGIVDHRAKKILLDGIFENTFSMVTDFGRKMRQAGTKPEFEAYDLGGIYNVLFFRDFDVWEEPMHFQFVFGVFGGLSFTPLTYLDMKSVLPQGATWSACGVGAPNQLPAAMMSAITGGHIRVGLEDNVRNLDRELAAGSWEQVEYAARIVRLSGREVASPAEARRILNLKRPGGAA